MIIWWPDNIISSGTTDLLQHIEYECSILWMVQSLAKYNIQYTYNIILLWRRIPYSTLLFSQKFKPFAKGSSNGDTDKPSRWKTPFASTWPCNYKIKLRCLRQAQTRNSSTENNVQQNLRTVQRCPTNRAWHFFYSLSCTVHGTKLKKN